MEDRKMRKRTWEAAGWPWGREMILSFEGETVLQDALDLSLYRIL
jgi:hypothetical protein